MKKIFTAILVLSAVIFSVSAANTPASKDVSVTSKARIITPITLANTDAQALDFGIIARGSTQSTIVVSHTATVTPNVTAGDAVVLTSSTQTAAKFTVGGEVSKTYNITIPTTTQTISDGASHTLDLTVFTCSKGASGAIAAVGEDNVFYVGATLTVPLDATAATYTGTFQVNVAYN
jgi:hypothetical protein